MPNPHSYPRVGVGVFVFKAPGNTHFLMGKRKGSIGAGTFSLPGGHLEASETFATCAAREVLEETGLEIEDVQFLTATETFFAGGEHYVTVFVRGVVRAGGGGEARVMEPDKCEGWEWFTFRQMREMGEREAEKLFLPCRNLLQQRPEVCLALEGREKQGEELRG